MAVKTRLPVPVETHPDPGWLDVRTATIVPVPVERAYRSILDIERWPEWDPRVLAVEIRDGRAGQPGATARMRVGTTRWSFMVVQMLVASAHGTAVFAGGGARWRFIEVIRLSPLGASRTLVERRMEIHLCGILRWAGPLVRAYAARHLRRALPALT